MEELLNIRGGSLQVETVTFQDLKERNDLASTAELRVKLHGNDSFKHGTFVLHQARAGVFQPVPSFKLVQCAMVQGSGSRWDKSQDFMQKLGLLGHAAHGQCTDKLVDDSLPGHKGSGIRFREVSPLEWKVPSSWRVAHTPIKPRLVQGVELSDRLHRKLVHQHQGSAAALKKLQSMADFAVFEAQHDCSCFTWISESDREQAIDESMTGGYVIQIRNSSHELSQ